MVVKQHFSDNFDHIVGGIDALLNFKTMTTLITLMHSKESKFHLTLNTFMSTAEHACQAFKSGLSFVLIRGQAIISDKV